MRMIQNQYFLFSKSKRKNVIILKYEIIQILTIYILASHNQGRKLKITKTLVQRIPSRQFHVQS